MPDKAKRKFNTLKVEYISLVDAGANKREVIWKRENPIQKTENSDSVTLACKIKKIDEEKRLVYGIVYAPDEVDAHGDTTTADVIEKAAHEFLGAGKTNRVDKQHDGNLDKGLIVESGIIKGEHELFPEEPQGAWYVAIKVIDDEVWEDVKKGDIGGISMEALAEVEQLQKANEGVIKEFISQIGKFMNGSTSEIPNGRDRLLALSKSNDELPAFGSFDQALKHFQDHPSVPLHPSRLPADSPQGESIQKDFDNELQGRMLHVAVSALDSANWSVLYNEFITEKKSALRTNVEQFLTHLESLQVSKSKPKNSDTSMATEEEKQKAAEAAKKAAGEEKETKSTEKDDDESEETEIEKLRKQNEDLTERLEKLEKTAGGEQGIEGREEESGKTKTAKGITWVPEK